MRKIHTSPSLVEIAHLRNVLAAEGIDCQVRNDRLAGVMGEVPFVECWPELWVCRPGDVLRARGLLDLTLHSPAEGEPWNCPSCGERIEGQFAACWNCAAAPADDLPP